METLHESTAVPKPLRPLEEPELGSYFVAAYPPFSRWRESAAGAWRRTLEQPPAAPATPLGLYVHVPFCIRRCPYCYYLAYDDRRLGEIDAYLDALGREAALLAEMPALAGRGLDFVYFGGGTPSLLSTSRLRRLFARLRECFPWDGVREVTFECAPQSVTVAKLRVLREAGVTRLSLGVQQLDDRVLERSGRIHRVADVESAWNLIHGMGFEVTNLDLMVGMVGETEASFRASLEGVLAMAPDSITLYQMEIPWHTPLAGTLRDGELPRAPATWEVKHARLGAAFDRLEEAGYHLRSAYGAVRDPARHRFLYQEEQYRGADLLGIGVSAFSYVGGVHHQNLASLEPYRRRLAAGDLPWNRAYALDADERLVREMVLQLKLGQVERRPLESKFGVDLAERFAEPLARFEALDLLTVAPGAVRLTRAGLARVDHMLPAFYLPRHRGGRYT